MINLVVILGPTAAGKSDLAIKAAKKFQGEIVSADSRQVYRGMDIGTGKVSASQQRTVPHHLLNVASPRRQFTVSQFRKLAVAAIKKISKSGRIPFLAGGTAFYIYSVVDGLAIPEVKPNLALRQKLEKKSAGQLFIILERLDPARAKTIDRHNPRRLIRAIEIVKATCKAVLALKNPSPSFNTLFLGINKDPKTLRTLINRRLEVRLKKGLIGEVRRLRKTLSYKKLESFGLEYRFATQYLQKKIDYGTMVTLLQTAIYQFSRRQMTWFKRDGRIRWVNNQREADRLIRDFLG